MRLVSFDPLQKLPGGLPAGQPVNNLVVPAGLIGCHRCQLCQPVMGQTASHTKRIFRSFKFGRYCQ